jgi:DNA-binding transcriptional MocR family regulator
MAEDFREALSHSAGAVSSLVQYLVSGFLEEGCLEPCLERARAAMSVRMRALAEGLREALNCLVFEVPQGGIYLWVTMPAVSDESLEQRAAEAGVSVLSGRRFSFCREKTSSVRLSISRLGGPFIKEATTRLASAWGKGL